MDKPKLKPGQSLMLALNFDEDDLEANQQGMLSDYQIGNLRKDVVGASRLVIGAVIFFSTLILVNFMLPSSTDQTSSRFDSSLIFLIAAGGLCLHLFWSAYRLSLEMRAGVVGILEDRIRLDIVNSNTSVGYKLYIEDREFTISKDVFLAFKNGDPYRIYYTPYSKQILSAEWLHGE